MFHVYFLIFDHNFDFDFVNLFLQVGVITNFLRSVRSSVGTSNKLKRSNSTRSGTFLLNLAKVYLSKLPLPVPLPLALFFCFFIFLGGGWHAARKIKKGKNKANGNGNGNGNFDRYHF